MNVDSKLYNALKKLWGIQHLTQNSTTHGLRSTESGSPVLTLHYLKTGFSGSYVSKHFKKKLLKRDRKKGKLASPCRPPKMAEDVGEIGSVEDPRFSF